MSEVPLYYEILGRKKGRGPLPRHEWPTTNICTTPICERRVGVVIPCALSLKESCPPRQNSRVERLKSKVEPLLT